jgi:hypothetical protein
VRLRTEANDTCRCGEDLNARATISSLKRLQSAFFASHGKSLGTANGRTARVVRGYRIRLNHRSESNPEISATTAAAAENRALISMFFFSSSSREFRDW